MRTNRRTFTAAQIVPRSYLEPLDLPGIFGRDAPLEVDLGCGDGSFLVALAQRHPERDFIGVERLVGRVRSACRNIGGHGLTNARIVQHDILYAVQQFFAPSSVEVFHLLFPDPWPKRRHQGRRVVSESFLRAVARALKRGGELRMVTDDRAYFRAVQAMLQSTGADLRLRVPSQTADVPSSTFGKFFGERAVGIYEITLRREDAAGGNKA